MLQWHLKNIPKILHVYWGGQTLPFSRWMTIFSFAKYNPDWQIKLYVPSKLSNKSSKQFGGNPVIAEDYMKFVSRKIVNICDMEKMFGISNDLSEVHKSDILRLHVLSTEGGCWVDMDVCFFKSMNFASFNRPEYADYNTLISYDGEHKYYSIGFLLASAGNEFFKELFNRAKTEVKKRFSVGVDANTVNYQKLGCEMYKSVCKTPDDIGKKYKSCKVLNIGMNDLYYFNSYNVDKLFWNTQLNMDMIAKSIGCHWYGGHKLSTQFETMATADTLEMSETMLARLFEKVYRGF